MNNLKYKINPINSYTPCLYATHLRINGCGNCPAYHYGNFCIKIVDTFSNTRQFIGYIREHIKLTDNKEFRSFDEKQ